MSATILKALTTIIFGFILREAPNVRQDPALQKQFEDSISTMLAIHADTVNGSLVDGSFDALILSALNYRESRMRLPTPDGDCSWTHKYAKLPSGQWPIGYKPEIKQVCNATGPMQINKGNTWSAPEWPEVQAEFTERDWRPETTLVSFKPRKAPWRDDPMTAEQLKEPKTNVRMAYAILQHWKNICVEKDGSAAPMGVWFTAYRWGKCPAVKGRRGYYVDPEAKLRCKIANSLATALHDDNDLNYTGDVNVPCTYADRKKAGS